MEEKNKNGKKGFYIALYSAVAVLALTAIAVTNTGSPAHEEQMQIEQKEDIAVNQSPVRSYKEQTTEQTTEAKTLENEKPAEENAVTEKVPVAVVPEVKDAEPLYTLFDDTKEMLWPVSGPIIMDYSVETGIFDKTLEQYRTHDSLCISAAVGESVIAAADGVVTAITQNDEKGKSVSVDHGNGWCTTYSQIDNISLAEGQIVKQGDVIGCIAQPTKYGSALGSHLDFSVTLDNAPTDPKLVLKTDE
ncbi:MAG: M23 family metallopeptidase [Firmicutes bacterium]|nr:M23 family metallopeptidase [Bacillota bacterium]